MNKNARILSIILAAAAGLLLLFTVLAALGVSAGPVSFLFRTFHLAAFYVPFYLAVCALILHMPRGTEKILLSLNLSLLPFLNTALFLHVLTGNRSIFISRYLITELGPWISIPFLLLLIVVECALIFKLVNFFFPDTPWLPADSNFRDLVLMKYRSLKRFFFKLSDKESVRDPVRDEILSGGKQEDDFDLSAPSFPLPEMPQPIPPVEVRDDSEIQSLISSVLKPGSAVNSGFNPNVPEDSAGNVRGTPSANTFNPDKTMSIDDIVNPIYQDDRGAENADPVHETEAFGMDEPVVTEQALSGSSEAEPAYPAEDPGIGFLIDEEDERIVDDGSAFHDVIPEAVPEIEPGAFPEVEPEAVPEVEPEALPEVEPGEIPDEEDYEGQGYITDRHDGLDAWRDEESEADEIPVSIEDKLSPEGETEKLGVLSPGMLPRHKRKMEYKVPVAGLLKEYPDDDFGAVDDYTRRQARALEDTLKEFKIEAKVVGISRGPVITMFEIQPSPGVKVSRIVNLQDNLALRLAASRIRIVAPIPGKQAIGIEVPNKKRSIVSYSELVSSEEFDKAEYEIPVILGKDISGGNQVIDLARTPHLLIAGSTGSGKSVCVNSLICSILYQKSPRDVKMIMVDPKIVELKLYNDIPHLLTPVITESKKAFQAVQWCLYEMERRYSLLDAMGVRDIKSYNKRIKERDIATTHLPYIVLVIDEFADLMATSGKELEGIVARLAAMSRAVGIHLVLATQRPSIDVITGLIKANFPSRIAFMVASKTDSRIIIDMMGAEKLLGKGDMLFTSAWDPFPTRVQGSFLSEDEVERVVSYVKTLGEPEYIDDEIFLDEDDFEGGDSDGGGNSSFSDPLYDKALEIVLAAGKASASYLQRRLQIGYNRAARLVEEMEIRGIVGPQNGSKPREVVHVPDRPGSEMLNTDG